MKVYYHTERTHAFVLRKSDLQKLWNLLHNQIGSVHAILECSDEITREFNDWEQFSLYDNPRTKKIVGLSLKAVSRDMSAEIHFARYSLTNIAINISGVEQIAVEIKEGISNSLDGTRAWYSPVVDVNFNLLFWMAYVLFVVWCFLLGPCDFTNLKKPDISIKHQALGFFIVNGLVLALHFLTKKLNILWGWLFPKAYFAIGQGKVRYKSVEKVRGILFAVALALVSLIGASIL